jgi:phosphoglycolate phosphatase
MPPMPNYSLAIFDFDGTLADSLPWFVSSLDRTCDRFGLRRVKPEEIGTFRDLSSREVLNRLAMPRLRLPVLAAYMRRQFGENREKIPLFPGASDMLRSLHAAGVKIALVSSNAEDNVRHVLGPATHLVHHYACGASLWGKAVKFRRAVRTLRQSASTTTTIGDEIRDIEAARQAGLHAGAITFGYNSRNALASAHPDHLFDSYEDLVRVVLG